MKIQKNQRIKLREETTEVNADKGKCEYMKMVLNDNWQNSL